MTTFSEPDIAINQFEHDPLPDPKAYFRLLEIQQAGLGEHAVCQLTTWLIEDAPPYTAISYTWGDSTSTTTVSINGAQMPVRANCEYVLRQAYASKTSLYYWIDAICIDQTGNHEKNHQVAMMGQLYKRAAHVLACIG
ncbi:HET-domain-containing protein, partial [Dothidotthia symphoricarpi CBS 119687]